ncbi:AAA family ATPase [Flagellimonas halotolerans]|uniref:AAA family ATPase n=1 Tax=Flagellimonas halotolerans TaxID=3112164 RepID=A0ABU6ISG9_9FLAO|nr:MULTISPECIES: AAA family ATPase [unclassified Allomuricauda]MEC3966231.1 AAA family ATPase [Muricauda sp. SYSU M86414]MEC4266083.1 AAA family ATPase [Muricauda sp. SYSU M84420]
MDALCYAALKDTSIDLEIKTLSETNRYNGKVFILPPWQDIYQTDAQRKRDWNQVVFTCDKMVQAYHGYQYDLIELPKAAVEKRADFILDHIKSN